MANSKEAGIPSGQLIRQDNNNRQELGIGSQRRQEESVPAPLMDQEVLRKLSHTPKGEDPAFWPLRVFSELNYYISVREASPNPAVRAIGNKYAPFQENIDRVSTAYSIVAYPHCKYEGWKENIESSLERDRQTFGRDKVELTDPEFKILNQITTARKIPLDPEKRVYSYSEVPISPYIDPDGMRHMTTEEIRKELNQNENGKSR